LDLIHLFKGGEITASAHPPAIAGRPASATAKDRRPRQRPRARAARAAFFFFATGLTDLADDGLAPGEWLGTILFSLAAGVFSTVAYYYGQRCLRKKNLSLHDDEDVEDE
jgi:hypothetical protein